MLLHLGIANCADYLGIVWSPVMTDKERRYWNEAVWMVAGCLLLASVAEWFGHSRDWVQSVCAGAGVILGYWACVRLNGARRS